MSIFNRGYHEKEKIGGGMLDKVVGLAKISAIVATGVALAKPIGRQFGAPISRAVESLVERYAPLPLKRAVSGQAGDLIESTMGRGLKALYQTPTTIRREFVNRMADEMRVDAAMNYLLPKIEEGRDLVVPGGRQHERFRSLLGSVFANPGSIDEVEQRLLNPKALAGFNKVAETMGVKFNFAHDFSVQQKEMLEILRETTKVSPSFQDISRFLGNQENGNTAVQVLRKVTQKEGRRAMQAARRLGMESLTIGEIAEDPRLLAQANRILTEASPRGGVAGYSSSSFGGIVEEVKRSLAQLYVPAKKVEQLDPLVGDMLDDLIRKTHSGLFIDRSTGRVTAAAQTERILGTLTENLLDELQFPLLPPVMNVRLGQLFRFLRPDQKVVKSLGALSGQSELMRRSRDSVAKRHGVMVADQLLSVGVDEQGTPNLIHHGGLRISAYDTKDFQYIKHLHASRLQPVEGLGDYVGRIGRSENVFDLVENILSRDIETYSNFDKVMSRVLSSVGELGITHEAGQPFATVGVIPKGPVKYAPWFFKTPTAKKLGMDPRMVADAVSNPQKAKLLVGEGAVVDPIEVFELVHNSIGEAANIGANLSEPLKRLGPRVRTDQGMFFKSPGVRELVADLAEHADSPEELLAILAKHLRTGNAEKLQELRSELMDTVSSSLYRAVNTILDDPVSFGRVGQSDIGLKSTLRVGILGETALSASHQRLQLGLLETMQSSRAAGKVVEAAGGVENLRLFWQEVAFLGQEGRFSTPEVQKFAEILRERMGPGANMGNVADFTGELFLLDKGTVDFHHLSRIGTVLLEGDEIFLGQTDDVVKTKLLRNMANTLAESEGIFDSQKTQMVVERMAEANVRGILETRFGAGGRAYHPIQDPLHWDPSGRYFVLPESGPELYSIIEDPLRRLGEGLRWMRDVAGGLWNPDMPLNSGSFALTALAQVPNQIGREVGLGLSKQDLMTASRSLQAFALKRVLPLVVGYEAYRNFNANMHEVGLPGLDDVGANVLGFVNIAGARFKDTLGLTDLNQWVVSALPGLDKYFTPRSGREYEDYLAYGNEGVRQGRGWLIASRQNIHGNRVGHFRPNFYRRWRSHWAEEAGLVDPTYSWLPNLSNPLAPISRLINPDWFEQAHRESRPYFGRGWEPEAGATRPYSTEESYLVHNSISAYGPLAIGKVSSEYPAGLYGGGVPGPYEEYGFGKSGPKGGRSGGGYGGGGFGGGGFGGDSPLGTYPRIGSNNGWGKSVENLFYRSQRALGEGTGYYEGGYVRPDSRGSGEMGRTFRTTLVKETPYVDVERPSMMAGFYRFTEGARSQMGLYGAIFQQMHLFPQEPYAFQAQRSSRATSFSRMVYSGERGELGSLMGYGEFFRRFLQPEIVDPEAWNPLRNNMPSWLGPRWQRGDPYMRVQSGIGELQLPGPAWEAANPWATQLRVRGSMTGFTEEELIKEWINPMGDEEESQGSKDILEFGNIAHEVMQRQLNAAGLLVGAEVSIYDPETNISGTIDAIVKGRTGMEIAEIKTQGNKSWGTTPEKYIDQITTYMAITGLQKGHLMFVNRDNPTQTRIETFHFDPSRWERIKARIERARAAVQDAVARGEISPYETYDILSRIQILSNLAPESGEFMDLVKLAESQGGFGGFEKKIFEQAKKQAAQLRNPHDLYPYVQTTDQQTRKLMVESINSDGTITTEMGTIRLAGVKWDPQAFTYRDPSEVFRDYGVEVGKDIRVTMIDGQFNEEVMADTPSTAIVGSLNKRLIESDYADRDYEDRHPLSKLVTSGRSTTQLLWEKLVHSDNLVTNKLIRVRSPLEQFERGEVYGTDRSSWDDIWGNYVSPAINSFVAKNPIVAGLQSGFTASLFVRSSGAKLAVGAVVGAAAAGISLGKRLSGAFTDTIWTPEAYRKQAEFDEYWDALEFVKQSALAEHFKTKARKEGEDIRELQASEDVDLVGLGPYGALALQAEKRARRTMMGYDEVSGSLQDALASIPSRQRQIAEAIITSGTRAEKQRFYELLPRAQKNVLGRFLGVDPEQIPKKSTLEEIFGTAYLPNVDWAGWNVNVDLDDLKTRAAGVEGMRVEKPNRTRRAQARARTMDIEVPNSSQPTPGLIEMRLHGLKRQIGMRNMSLDYAVRPAERNIVNVNMDAFEDETSRILQMLRENAGAEVG